MGSSRPGNNQTQVVIGDDPSDTVNFVVDREIFWVSKSHNEVVEWFCVRNQNGHVHGSPNPCFTVRFNKLNGSPFAHPDPSNPSYTSDSTGYAVSNPVKHTVSPDSNRLYGYTIEAIGKNPLDPGGGVKG
jgi:hypothetical protein